MKIIKKILRIICIILPCFGFVLFNSSNSFAKEYTIDRIPAVNVHLGSPQNLYNNFSIDFGSNPIPSGLKLSTQTGILSTWDSTNSTCKFSSVVESVHYNSPEYNIGINGFYDKYYSSIPASRCNNIQFFQSSSLDSNYDWSSFGSSGNTFVLSQLYHDSKFYPFEYRYFYAHDTEYVDNVKYSNYLRISDLIGVAPGKFKKLSIPFELDSDLIGGFSSGRSVEFKGSFNFPAPPTNSSAWQGVPFDWASDYMTNAYFRLSYRYFTDDFNNSQSGSVNCSVKRTYISSLTGNSDAYQLSYSCPLVLPADSFENRSYGFNLEIGTTGTYVWDSAYDWDFNALYVVTDNDNSPGGSAVSPQYGSNPVSAPGSALNPSDEQSFWDKLNNAFNIQMLNPFYPFFMAFSSHSRCHQLPILHDFADFPEELCRIYPDSVLDVTTPVLMIFTTILIFSLFMYWLRDDETAVVRIYHGGDKI